MHKRRIKDGLLHSLIEGVKGEFLDKGYFAVSHKLVTKGEFNSFNNRHKLSFSECYNIVTFKTHDANWEFFFHLVRDGFYFSEIMTIRVFPKHLKIRSEGNVEKNYSRLNIFANNRYLTEILEAGETNDYLKWLIRHNGDILLISHNNLHFKAFLNSSKISYERVMDMIKALNSIKNKVYREDVIEY